MRYSLSLEIDAPRTRIVELFINPDHWHKWQESLVSFDNVKGAGRETGSVTKIINRFGRKNVEILETVESNQLPEEFICTYEAQGAWNRVINRFVEVTPDRTRWEFDTEFRCQGFLKVMSIIMPGMFKKASNKEMIAFKNFVEANA